MGVNLHKALQEVKYKATTEAGMLAAVARIWEQHENRRLARIQALQSNGNAPNGFDFDLLEPARVFHLDQIRKVCIDYRLRFLESQRFKNQFPEEALVAIRELEESHQTRLGQFKVMAPTKAFRLDNYDDPLLFAPLGNDYYYLVHQWGKELRASRRWLVLPVRNIGWFTAFCLLISALLTWMLPLSKLALGVNMAEIIVFLFAFKSVFAVLLYGFFMGGRQFSASMWNSRFYNQ